MIRNNQGRIISQKKKKKLKFILYFFVAKNDIISFLTFSNRNRYFKLFPITINDVCLEIFVFSFSKLNQFLVKHLKLS